MGSRKYDISKMTQADLAEVERLYPKAKAVETIRRPVYRIIAMLMDCGLDVSGVIRVGTEADEVQNGDNGTSDVKLPAFLKGAQP
jgi:hypothetical protein